MAALLALCAGGDGSAQQNFGPWGVDLTARDQKVKPGDDFFDYANGGWLARTPIPPVQASASAGRDIFNLTQEQLRALIETSAAKPTTPTAAQIGGLYKSFMDEAAVEALDAKPLANDLAAIQAVASKPEFVMLMAQTASNVGASVFALQPYADAKKPVTTLYLGQGGLGMPDRDYYRRTGSPTRSRRTKRSSHGPSRCLPIRMPPPRRRTFSPSRRGSPKPAGRPPNGATSIRCTTR